MRGVSRSRGRKEGEKREGRWGAGCWRGGGGRGAGGGGGQGEEGGSEVYRVPTEVERESEDAGQGPPCC